MILIGDHDGNLRISQNLIANTENRGTCPGTGDLEMLKSMLFQVIRYGPLRCLNGIWLRVNAGCCTSLMASPVVHQSWNMNDFFRSVGQTQDHIMILGTVKCGTEQFLSF